MPQTGKFGLLFQKNSAQTQKGTAAKKVAKQEAKELKDSGGAAEGSAMPVKKRAKKAAVESQ